jgi:hypothetical protein
MTGTIRANKYAGACIECGHPVAAEAGRIEKRASGWKVLHLAGQCGTSPAPAPAPPAPRKNMFPGDCTECGQHLAANAGLAVRGPGGWGVRHRGDCPPPPAPLPDVPEGRYATPSTRPGQLNFWVIDHPTTGHKAGVVFIKKIIGGRPDEALYGEEARAGLEEILAAGVEAARDRYADETDECWACGTNLTEGLSRLVKIGPDCCPKRYGMTQRQLLAVREAAAGRA